MLLGPGDALPHRPRRLLVAGTSGAGKTTLSARAGELLGLPHVELDGLWRTHPRTAHRVAALLGQRPGLPVVRLRSRREVGSWVEGPLRAATG